MDNINTDPLRQCFPWARLVFISTFETNTCFKMWVVVCLNVDMGVFIRRNRL